MSDSVHGFPEGSHNARVETHVRNIPGKTGGSTHGAGVVGEGGADPTFATPAMHGFGPGAGGNGSGQPAQDSYGPVTSGQKGHPGTD